MTVFEQLYKDHYPAVYKTCLMKFHDEDFAAEATQEAFTRALVYWEDLREKEKFLSWVTRIAMHYGYNQTRLNMLRFNELPPDDLMGNALLFASPEAPDREEAQTIRRWILTQPESDQELFLMKHYYFMTHSAISERTGIPLSTVKRRLTGMQDKLKKVLEEGAAMDK